MSCINTKTQGQGMFVRCGEKEWDENSETYLCESCLKKENARLEQENSRLEQTMLVLTEQADLRAAENKRLEAECKSAKDRMWENGHEIERLEAELAELNKTHAGVVSGYRDRLIEVKAERERAFDGESGVA